MKIALIGAGNVAHHLAVELEGAGHDIITIYSRKLPNAEALSDRLSIAVATNELNFAESEAELFVLTTSDDALEKIIPQIVWPEEALVVHTAGAKSLAVLQNLLQVHSDVPLRTGVLYPLQSINKKIPLNWKEVPICIEGADEEIEHQLIEIARTISDEVYLVNSEERLQLHLAAVLANNFPNHLWALTKDLLAEHNLDFELMKPILKETLRKALDADHPAEVQTGPARRGDQTTMARHLQLLEDQPELARIYQTISESIMRWYL